MRKLLSVFAVTIGLLCAASAAVCAEDAYVEKSVEVINEDEGEAAELTVRFYEETPNVPYIGMNEFSEYVSHRPLTFVENEDGTCSLANEIGEELVCDPAAGVISWQDWNRFFDPALPIEGEAKGIKDSNAGFVRVTGLEYEGEAVPVTLDFAKYGISVYADSEDIYLPVSTMSNVMTDISTRHMLYNGDRLYVRRVSLDGKMPEGYYETEMFRALKQGGERPEDIAKQSYGDLCLNFDYFFGHPGIAPLDSAIEEKGLDQALLDLGQAGKDLRDDLLSTDFRKYLKAVNKLFLVYLSDGHTVFTGSADPAIIPYLGTADPLLDMLQSETTMKQTVRLIIPVQRMLAWGNENYREYGSTAIIRLDSFMPDEAAWDSYYRGEGEFPEDGLGIIASGLKKASENPEIKNVIFDISCNGGGSSDVLMAILALTTGQDRIYGEQKLTGQKMTATFEADTNFDGVFDEKDKETIYPFNYGVLVTRYAFSCGNLFPIIIQDGGAVLIGEPSSGGSCCIQVGSDIEGLSYVMSSVRWRLTDQEGVSVEAGCKIDLPLDAESNEMVNSVFKAINVDEGIANFKNYFDEASLDEMMNSWFADQAETDEAA